MIVGGGVGVVALGVLSVVVAVDGNDFDVRFRQFIKSRLLFS